MSGGGLKTAIGLMSGTSLDGIDAALIRTDGEDRLERLGFVSIPYEDGLRADLRRCLGRTSDDDGFIGRTEIEMTRAHAAAVDWLLSRTGAQPGEIDLIGFHGQTIHHDPAAGFTWQIGSGPMLARLTGIDVVNDFRTADVRAGGQGAPLIPLYHKALASAAGLRGPLCILNIGGVANLTFIGADGAVMAFDTGPGNALLNDWVKKRLDREYDEGGMLARQGTADAGIVARWLSHDFFSRPPPKSLDRDAWDVAVAANLSAADGAATLAAFTVQAVARSRDHLPQAPLSWHVTGGGRHNPVLMEGLRAALGVTVAPVDDLGWDGDALEAEGFAYLAVRSRRGLPLSLPATTGVPAPQTGGQYHKAALRPVEAR